MPIWVYVLMVIGALGLVVTVKVAYRLGWIHGRAKAEEEWRANANNR